MPEVKKEAFEENKHKLEPFQNIKLKNELLGPIF